MAAVAYLILAHDRAEQLGRLIRQLRSSDADVFVHIDAKVAIGPFLQSAGEGVHFTTKRMPVYWRDYSQVAAILVLIETALETGREYDYLVLLSGTDYPVRSGHEIVEFFDGHRGANFITCAPMPHESKPLSRLTDYRGKPGPAGWAWGKFTDWRRNVIIRRT